MVLGEARKERLDEGKIKTLLFGTKQVTARELAKNPKLAIAHARKLAARAGAFFEGSREPTLEEALHVIGLEGGGTNLAQAQAVLDFYSESQALKQAFVDSEVARLYGDPNVTSRSSTVNTAGVRTEISGQGTTPTAEQIAAIAENFQTPLQLLEAGKDPNQLFRPSSQLKPRTPTIVSGAGVRRRPRGSATPRPTLLTSDSDAAVLTRGRTLLG
jgi:hypothetical protein